MGNQCECFTLSQSQAPDLRDLVSVDGDQSVDTDTNSKKNIRKRKNRQKKTIEPNPFKYGGKYSVLQYINYKAVHYIFHLVAATQQMIKQREAMDGKSDPAN